MRFNHPFLKTQLTKGFSLTEVVLTIAIVSVLAGLAVPGILTSANNSKRLSATKQTISLIGDALNEKVEANAVDVTQGFSQFVNVGNGGGLPYTRYLVSGAVRRIDSPPNPVNLCTAAATCTFTPAASGAQAVTLKNGGILYFDSTIVFGSGVNAAVPVVFDPDGDSHGDRNSVELWLYADGRLHTARTIIAGTTVNAGNTAVAASAIADPSWLVL
jgi:prepilin-type N-terminal cleavage/methylation domain-containing protein